MIIVILVICIGLIALGYWLTEGLMHEFTGVATTVVGGIGLIISLIALIVFSVGVSNLKVIDQKIDMYQEENVHIESQIAECIKQYQEYETGIFTEVKSESAMTLVALYPELKSDVLVAKQIEVYIANNEKIKELKETKIDGAVYRWWLYFG